MKTSIILSLIALTLTGCTTTYVQVAAPKAAVHTKHHATHTRTTTTVETTQAAAGDGEIHFIRPGQTSFQINPSSSPSYGGSRAGSANDPDAFTATTR